MAHVAATSLPFSQSHAFIIGVEAYEAVVPLTTPVQDAVALADRLAHRHHYTVHGPLINPRAEELRQYLHEYLPAQVKDETERVLVYFAGHGIALDEASGPSGYLLPADAIRSNPQSLIAMEEVHQALEALPCRHGFLILDCCFAGAFKWSAGFRSLMWDTLPKVVYQERFDRYCKDPAWQVLSSAAYDQKALDVIQSHTLGLRNPVESQHSPFAWALLEALDGKADLVPEGGDGLITATELYVYLRERLEQQTLARGQRQTPSLFPLKRHDKGEYLFLSPGHRLNLPATPNRNPFKGLTSFEEEDASLFYGRDRVIQGLKQKIEQEALVVVTGASGTGKSSVLKAGILPWLRAEGYHIMPVLRPGKAPLASLREAEQALSPDQPTAWLIDQFEELVTQTASREEAQQVQHLLAEWLQRYPRLKLMLSLRADFEPQFEEGPLKARWQQACFPVPAFSHEELRQVIVKPAVQEVLIYEPESLVNRMIDEVNQAPGALPLLSFTLSELYHAYLRSGRQDRAMTQADYEQLGGVIGSLRTRAEEVYQKLDAGHQASMRGLMLRMVALEGGETAGRRVYQDELVFDTEDASRRTRHVVRQLLEARLIVSDKDAQERSYVEPAHDALVRAWATLWEWIKSVGEERLLLQTKVGQAVDDYEAAHEDVKLLWDQDPRLDQLVASLEGATSWMNARERQFVGRSVKRKRQRRRRFIATLLGVMLGLAGLAALAVWQAGVAQQNARAEALARQEAEANLIEALRFQVNVQEERRSDKERARTLAFAIDSSENAYVRRHLREIDSIDQIIARLNDSILQLQTPSPPEP